MKNNFTETKPEVVEIKTAEKPTPQKAEAIPPPKAEAVPVEPKTKN